mmetsp:Transcript_23726/g.63811  ORF Transcript_23726/g.63811 Transcript_23726/m.63811 type:complete len:175 (-) Transcript_23726:353-877(-)
MSRRAVTGWTWTRSASTTLQVLREHHFTTDPNPRPPLPSSPCPCRPLPPLTLTRLPPEEEELVPTVFRWEHGGRQVYITGTFNNWEKQIQMHRSGNDFTYIHNLKKVRCSACAARGLAPAPLPMPPRLHPSTDPPLGRCRASTRSSSSSMTSGASLPISRQWPTSRVVSTTLST